MGELTLEHDNMRAALAWSLADSDPASAEAGLWLADALGPLWFMRDHIVEGAEWYERLLAANPGMAPRKLDSDAKVSPPMRPPSRPNVHGEHPRVIALIHQSMFVGFLGDVERSNSALEEAIAVGRRFGDGLGTANAILTLAQYSRNVGDHDRARAMGEEGAVLGKAVGDVYGIWRTHGMFGDILLAAGDLERAYSSMQRASTPHGA